MTRGQRIRHWSAGVWLKSSRSYGTGDCVEVRSIDGDIKMRDSKNPDGPQLSFTQGEWAAFVAGVRAGDFDRLS